MFLFIHFCHNSPVKHYVWMVWIRCLTRKENFSGLLSWVRVRFGNSIDGPTDVSRQGRDSNLLQIFQDPLLWKKLDAIFYISVKTIDVNKK